MNHTYLMQLHLFEARVSLFLIVHVEDLYQFQRHKFAIIRLLRLEYVREFSLA